MTDQELHAGLMTKLNQVMADVVSLDKTGVNKDQGYAFVEASEVLSVVHKAMVAHGLTYTPAINGVEYVEGASRNGNMYRHYLLDLTITLHDCETGAMWAVPWKGESIDYQDKGLGKALTLCLKYFWLQTLMIGTGETDPDSITPITDGSGQRPVRHQPARPIQGGGNVEPDSAPGSFVMFMGKHKGSTLREIAANPESADYLQWVIDNIEPKQPGDDRAVLVASCKAMLGMVDNTAQPPAQPGAHWTVGQDWGQFYAAVSKLGLTNEDVHAALMVESAKDYKGSKEEAWSALLSLATETVVGWPNNAGLTAEWFKFLNSLPQDKRPSPADAVKMIIGDGNLAEFKDPLAVAKNIVLAKVG